MVQIKPGKVEFDCSSLKVPMAPVNFVNEALGIVAAEWGVGHCVNACADPKLKKLLENFIMKMANNDIVIHLGSFNIYPDKLKDPMQAQMAMHLLDELPSDDTTGIIAYKISSCEVRYYSSKVEEIKDYVGLYTGHNYY